MGCRWIALIALLALPLSTGCGGSESATSTAAKSGGNSGSPPSDPAARVVYEFFEAVRNGQTDQANSLLTPLAQQRITAQNMNIAPPGSATARFQIGAVNVVASQRAIVSLTWSDVDSNGARYSEPILCEVRMCDGAWRICGMAQDLGPEVPPMVMDFESPENFAAPAAGQAAASAANASQASTPQAPANDPFQQSPGAPAAAGAGMSAGRQVESQHITK